MVYSKMFFIQKEMQHNHLPASIILSTLASLIPLICRSFLGKEAIDSTVERPAFLSFFISSAAIPYA
jgi:hypothetical protein